MRIKLSSVFVDDQEKALRFYTRVMGFVGKRDLPAGKFRWLTVVSPEEPGGPELLLEPNENPAAKAFTKAIFEQGIPAAAFAVDDIQQEYERLKRAGVRFTLEPTLMGPVTQAVFDDTCGNLVQIYSTASPLPGAESPPQPREPAPELRRLDVMTGTWTLQGRESGQWGEIRGKLTFEWMEGGFFFEQKIDIDYIGLKIRGIEIIGYDPVTQALTSHVFDNQGDIFDYVWEIGDHSITIWGGYVGSPAHFTGRFSDDKHQITGRWEWPGGGYEATMTRAARG